MQINLFTPEAQTMPVARPQISEALMQMLKKCKF